MTSRLKAGRQPSGRNGKWLTGILLVAPAVGLILVFFVFPMTGVFLRSISEPAVGVENYTVIVQSVAFRNILRTTLEIALITTLGCLLLGAPLAWYLSTLKRSWALVLLVLSTAPLWVAILARLYAWTVILGRKGVLNESLIGLGIVSEPLDLLFTRSAVIIGLIHVMLPYMVLILYASMRGIDPALMQAARSMGSGSWFTFRKVFVPLIAPGAIAASLLIFIMSLGFFILPAVLGGGADITLPMYVQRQIRVGQWGVASAMSITLLVATLVLFAVVIKLTDPARILVGGVRR
jgi:putative spermidine/putrescine transport system permease protein